mmetsp:Transcript_100275/g.173250  ORF Transcript_100275/g.173250 Transcript_100275/m.173250 type:complete len:96 (+) Transcript_100275:90-377(+)
MGVDPRHTLIQVRDPIHDLVCNSDCWAMVVDPQHTLIQVCDPIHDPVCNSNCWERLLGLGNGSPAHSVSKAKLSRWLRAAEVDKPAVGSLAVAYR